LSNRAAIESSCAELVREAELHVAHIVVRPPVGTPRGLRVWLAGDEIQSTLIGVPVVVDAGDVVLRAVTSSGESPFEARVHVAAGETATVQIRFAPAESPTSSASPAAARTSSAPTSVGTSRVAASSPAPAGDSTSGSRPSGGGSLAGPVVVMAAGVASLGAAGVFAYLQQQALSRCVTLADGSLDCLQNDARSARTFNVATNVGLVAGGVLFVGGAAWLLVQRLFNGRNQPHTSAPTIAVAALGAASLAASGVFFYLQGQTLSHCASRYDGSVDCLPGDAATARTFNVATNVGLVTGTTLLAGGAAWLLGERVARGRRDREVTVIANGTEFMLVVGGQL
jgi:hypothetical protein